QDPAKREREGPTDDQAGHLGRADHPVRRTSQKSIAHGSSTVPPHHDQIRVDLSSSLQYRLVRDVDNDLLTGDVHTGAYRATHLVGEGALRRPGSFAEGDSADVLLRVGEVLKIEAMQHVELRVRQCGERRRGA